MTGKVAQAPPSYHGNQGGEIPGRQQRSRTRDSVPGTRQVNLPPAVINVQPGQNRSTQFTVHGNNANQSGYESTLRTPSPESFYPPDYSGAAVTACLCCFPPTGCAALIFALWANNLAAEGELERAHEKALHARNLFVASIVIGIMIDIGLVIFIILLRAGLL